MSASLLILVIVAAILLGDLMIVCVAMIAGRYDRELEEARRRESKSLSRSRRSPCGGGC
jgi:hypothetical protein